MVSEMGGLVAWEALPEAEKEAKLSGILVELYRDLAEEAMERLTESEREGASLFVWVSYCMHKDLNAMKGRNLTMQEV